MVFPQVWSFMRGVPFAREFHTVSLSNDQCVRQLSSIGEGEPERFALQFDSYDSAIAEVYRLRSDLGLHGWTEVDPGQRAPRIARYWATA